MRSRSKVLSRRARPWLVLLLIWSLGWKGLSLWRAAENRSKPWFVTLLFANTAGILDVIYLYVVDSKQPIRK